MKKSTRVLVIGPLAPYVAGYRAELDAQGYSPWTAVSYQYSFARLSRWLAARGLPRRTWTACVSIGSSPPDPAVARVRCGGRTRAACPRCWATCSGWEAPRWPWAGRTSVAGSALLDEFAAFLRTERGLAEKTIDWYRRAAGLFLATQVGHLQDLGTLSAGQINAFVLAQAGSRGAGSLNNMLPHCGRCCGSSTWRGCTATP